MKITVEINDERLAQAQELTGEKDLAVLLDYALTSLIPRESGMALARLGGTKPQREDPARRRSEISEF